ncbi:patatin-like phospholipase family protein [Aeromicrobium terrae]|uniref:Patatin-like phospholipase family protein n=1 Tax=Aeromicrobium terrae TaxID=2498846 RepID=A0A5C8NH72_9ACTN|nr:patatin-like phospholipase family protein [Aeromicrobium terrae]TXL57724.1 patatin-like phospholipase family protein [Aeromicrobium terrae]
MDAGGSRVADLVLEGGGVKGIALTGAIGAFDEQGWSFPRIAGTSAGAIVGSVLAALQTGGEPMSQVVEIAKTLDYRRFRDRGFPGNVLGPLGVLTDPFSVLVEQGVYEGDYLHDWLRGVLADLGVKTFGDLKRVDPDGDGHVHHEYGLVVTASDISRKRLAYLPWDYADYGLDPDEQHVADAVRASASIPYFFEPVTLEGAHGASTLVDGGLLSNYPISAFDRLDELPPRWATVGVRLDALGIAAEPDPKPVRNVVTMGLALVETAIEANQAEHVLDPCNIARSVYVDTHGFGTVDFTIDAEQQQELIDRGRAAAETFLAGWDYDAWLARCRPAWVR